VGRITNGLQIQDLNQLSKASEYKQDWHLVSIYFIFQFLEHLKFKEHSVLEWIFGIYCFLVHFCIFNTHLKLWKGWKLNVIVISSLLDTNFEEIYALLKLLCLVLCNTGQIQITVLERIGPIVSGQYLSYIWLNYWLNICIGFYEDDVRLVCMLMAKKKTKKTTHNSNNVCNTDVV